jgi:hypothetical protein
VDIQTATTTYTFSNPVYSLKTNNGVILSPIDDTNQNFQFSQVTAVTQYPIASSSSPVSGFSYGDITISTLLIIMIILNITGGVFNFIIGQKRRVPTS